MLHPFIVCGDLLIIPQGSKSIQTCLIPKQIFTLKTQADLYVRDGVRVLDATLNKIGSKYFSYYCSLFFGVL